jgi:hypothetical protein
VLVRVAVDAEETLYPDDFSAVTENGCSTIGSLESSGEDAGTWAKRPPLKAVAAKAADMRSRNRGVECIGVELRPVTKERGRNTGVIQDGTDREGGLIMVGVGEKSAPTL